MSHAADELITGAHAGMRTASPARKGLRGHPWLTLLAAALGVMMVGIDGTIVAVANPSIQSHLHASLADIQWVTNGYLLSLAVTLITIGKIGDRFGHRKVFITGIIGFAASSAAIGLSGTIGGSISLIIAFRVAQGVFGAMLQPTALALIRETFPIEKLNAAIGIWGAVVAASSAAGPIVGGLLVQHLNWESCFYVNVPVGLIALVVGILVIKETRRSGSGSFDIPGIGLLTAFLFLLVWGLIKAPDTGWASGQTIGYFAGAAAALVLFIVREAKTRQPLLPLKLFRSAKLSAGTVLVLMLMFAMFGAMFFMTFFMENVHGLDPIAAGVRLLPLMGLIVVGAPLSGTLITRIGPRVPMTAGMLLAAVALFGLSRLGLGSSLNDTILWFALLGLGLSPIMVGATEVIVGGAAVELAGVASGLQSTAMQVGGTIGTAVLGAIMSAKVSGLLPASWTAAHLPALNAGQLAAVKSSATVGVAPVPAGSSPQVAAAITNVTHSAFVSGMSAAFVVAACVALAGAVIAALFLGRKGGPRSDSEPGSPRSDSEPGSVELATA
jgi:EmrB/QacA subfamily drug resistance transporter